MQERLQLPIKSVIERQEEGRAVHIPRSDAELHGAPFSLFLLCIKFHRHSSFRQSTG